MNNDIIILLNLYYVTNGYKTYYLMSSLLL